MVVLATIPTHDHYRGDVALLWAMTIPGLACLLVVLVALERFGLWMGGRSWLPWRRRRTRAAMSATSLDELTALFYATKHHELQQRRTELMLRDDEGDGAPRAFRLVDGESGPTITVR